MKNVDENSIFLLPHQDLGRIVVAQNRETEDACDEPWSSVCPRLRLPVQVLGISGGFRAHPKPVQVRLFWGD